MILDVLLIAKNITQTSVRLLSRREFDGLRMDLGAINYKALIQTILGHSKKFDLMTLGTDPAPEIRLKLICPIFRLADTCDQSSRRVKVLLFKILVKERLLDEETKKIWNAHLNVENIVIKGTLIEPRV